MATGHGDVVRTPCSTVACCCWRCANGPVPRKAVDDAIGHIEEKQLSLAQREIKSDKLGELVMRELKRLDKVAYIRFASVYRSFEDVDEFAEVVKEVRPAGRAAKRKRA